MKRANIGTQPRIVRELLDYIVARNGDQGSGSTPALPSCLLEITGDQNLIAGRDININISVTVLIGPKEEEIGQRRSRLKRFPPTAARNRA